MKRAEEIEMLKKKCLKKDGNPKANATAEDLQRLMTLQNRPPDPNDRITVETVRNKDIIKVAPGTPMTLEGLNEDEKWKVIAVISSNGAAGLELRRGVFTKYRLDAAVRKHMQHNPPKVSMKPGDPARAPKVITK
jgi:hypothetical protein